MKRKFLIACFSSLAFFAMSFMNMRAAKVQVGCGTTTTSYGTVTGTSSTLSNGKRRHQTSYTFSGSLITCQVWVYDAYNNCDTESATRTGNNATSKTSIHAIIDSTTTSHTHYYANYLNSVK